MKILRLSIIVAIVIVSVISSSNSTFAQNVTNSSNSIIPIPSSILNSPAPTLTPSENQTIVGIALSVPGLQNWSHDWRYVSTGFLGNNKLATTGFEWQYAIVYLKASSSNSLIPCDNNNDWSAMVTVDMTTMKAISSNYPTIESHNCNYTISGGPDISKVSSMMGSPLQQFMPSGNTSDGGSNKTSTPGWSVTNASTEFTPSDGPPMHEPPPAGPTEHAVKPPRWSLSLNVTPGYLERSSRLVISW